MNKRGLNIHIVKIFEKSRIDLYSTILSKSVDRMETLNVAVSPHFCSLSSPYIFITKVP